VEQFVERAQAHGAQVHFAGDAKEARTIALELARRHGSKLAIKMKSMLTEEVHLVDALEAGGVSCVETDLGEWILQLAKETPSHLIAPALHKDKASIKRLFDEHLTPDQREEAEALVERAQQALRDKFVTADLGITGCNFAVAETGTLVMVSNEGNGRLVMAGPAVHIALVPFEKIVPTLSDVTTLLKMLISSATGQKITACVSFITGPRRPDEQDGPTTLHIIIVDNGRSETLNTGLEEALCCIRCGACLNACPVYRRVGGHTYGSVYSGPIGIALTPIVNGASVATDELAHASSLCGACEEVCPVHIDIPRLILETRRRSVEARRPSWGTMLVFWLYTAIMTRPWLYRLARWLGSLGSSLLSRDGRIERFPGGAKWTQSRSLPAVARESFRARFARRSARAR
jgi:L-lactate dehydrogenase complex protein LldF